METTKQILIDLQKMLVDDYKKQLEALPMKKNVRETLADGFQDGARLGIHHVVQMLGVEVKA